MNASRLVTIVVVSLLLVSLGTTVASGSHDGLDIFDWIDDTAGDDDYYGIGEPRNEDGEQDGIEVYPHFSGDADKIDPDNLDESINENFDSEMSDKETEKAVYLIGDYVYSRPQNAVVQWNQQNSQNDFDSGGDDKTTYPEAVPHETHRDGTYIKDAYTTFYSIDPSSIVHLRKSFDGNGNDETEYRVGQNINVNVIMSSRVEGQPDTPDYAFDSSTKAEISRVDYDVEYTRLFTSRCAGAGPGEVQDCLLADQQNGDEHVRFSNVELYEEGYQDLRVESKYSVEYKIERYDRVRDCSLRDEDARPGTPCPWGSWGDRSSVSYTSEELIVEDTKSVIATSPEVTATKANLPLDREEYHFEGLDRAEWSRITFGRNNQEEVGVRSAWRYFGSRNQNWDRWCEVDGDRDGRGGDDCEGTFADPSHYTGSGIRPLLTHAVPSPFGILANGENTRLVYEQHQSHSYPNVQSHPTCNGDCHWNFVMFQKVDKDVETYKEPGSIVVQRTEPSSYARVYGQVGGSGSDVEITNTRDVKLATISSETLKIGRDLSEDERANMDNPPAKSEVQIKVSIYEEESGDPINLNDRKDEHIRIEVDQQTHKVQTGSDGEAILNIKDTSGPNRFSYQYRDWWTVPEDEQAYVTRGAMFHDPKSSFSKEQATYTLFNFIVIIMIPIVIFISVLRAAGMDVSLYELWEIIKDGFLP